MRGYPEAPASIGQVLDLGISLYRDAFRQVLPLAALTAVIGQLPTFWSHLVAGESVGLSLLGLPLFIVVVVGSVAGMIGQVVMIDSLARGEELKAGEAVRAGLPRLLPVIGGFILYACAALIGLLLLVIPMFIVLVSLSFGWFLIILDRRNAIDGVVGSHRLVWGSWWRTAAIMTVAALLYYIPVMLIFAAVGTVAWLTGSFVPGEGVQELARSIELPMAFGSMIAGMLFMPLMISISLAQFRDLKLRKSGADLVLRAEAA